MQEFHSKAYKARGSRQLSALIGEYKNKVSGVAVQEGSEVLRIGIVGEIYTVIEPYVNQSIDEKLG